MGSSLLDSVNKNARQPLLLAIAGGIAMLFFAVCLVAPMQAHALMAGEGDIDGVQSVSTASGETVKLGLDGTFGSAGKEAVLKRINEIRLEACKEHVPDPYDPDYTLSEGDYLPIKWSHGLEEIAQTRAAEACVCLAHTRPNGELFNSVDADGVLGTEAENLAWNYSGMLEAIEQWYEEKADWVAQTPGAVTGHYKALIDYDYTHIGLGEFRPTQGGWTCTAAEFVYDPTRIDETEIGARGACRQTIEVLKSSVAGLSIKGSKRIVGNVASRYSTVVALSMGSSANSSISGGARLVPLDSVTWTSSNPKVLEVDFAGIAKAKGCGVAVLTASTLGMKANITVKVVPAEFSIKKLVAKKNAIKVTWAKKPAFAKGYEIRYSLKKSMKSAKTVKVKVSKKSRVIKNLKSKKRYYVQIRSYAKAGGKMYYSTWSKKKSVVVK